MKLEEARRDIKEKQLKRKYGKCYNCEHLDLSYKGILIRCKVYQDSIYKYLEFYKIMLCKYKEEIKQQIK